MCNALQLGIRVDADPIPPIAENTRYVDAGPLVVGVEFRLLTDDLVDTNYEGSDSKGAVDANRPPGVTLDDEGVSLHVCERETGIEYLRFDLFRDDPHYHYIHHGAYQQIVAFDRAAHGDMLDWVIEAIRSRLPDMLEQAGAHDLSRRVDRTTPGAVITEIEALARAAERTSS